MANLRKGMKLRAIFSAETPDKSGEIVKISGVDLSAVANGTALVNSEHDQSFAKTIGKITKAKKIFEEKDCLDKFEKNAFISVNRVPLIVGEIELFDNDDHQEAKAVASIVKHFSGKKEKLPIGFSVEGAIVSRDGAMINKSIVRKVAITCTPCNDAAKAELLSELSKSEVTVYEKLSSQSKTENTISSGFTCELAEDSPNEILQNWSSKVTNLQKALEAGMATGSPASLSQGAALQSKGTKGKIHKTSGESSESSSASGEETPDRRISGKGQETTDLAENGLNPVNKEVIKEIDDKKKDEASLKIKKLKKAELLAYNFFKDSLKR